MSQGERSDVRADDHAPCVGRHAAQESGREAEVVSELLHAWAVAPAALSTCCLAAQPGAFRARAAELAASALMVVAMIDAALTAVLAPVFWAGILLAAAMALAARHGLRLRRAPSTTAGPPAGGGPIVHGALGMIAMGALMLAMGHDRVAGVVSDHEHHASTVSFGVLLIAGAAVYAAASVALALRQRSWATRVELGAMGVSCGLMALAAL